MLPPCRQISEGMAGSRQGLAGTLACGYCWGADCCYGWYCLHSQYKCLTGLPDKELLESLKRSVGQICRRDGKIDEFYIYYRDCKQVASLARVSVTCMYLAGYYIKNEQHWCCVILWNIVWRALLFYVTVKFFIMNNMFICKNKFFQEVRKKLKIITKFHFCSIKNYGVCIVSSQLLKVSCKLI